MLEAEQSWSISTGLARTRKSPRLLRRTARWATLAVCAALLLGTVGEMWARVGIERQVHAVQQQNDSLQRDVSTTQADLRSAQSPSTIEREARSWGYARPGEVPVVVTP